MDRRKEYIKDTYSKFWKSHIIESADNPEYYRYLSNLILSNVQIRNAKILSCCMGTGYPFEIEFVRSGINITGFDIAESLVKECINNFTENGFAINPCVADAEYIPFKDKSFDVVYCYRATSYLPDLRKAIFEMFRVIRGGGALFIDAENLLYPRHIKETLIRKRLGIFHQTPFSIFRVLGIAKQLNNLSGIFYTALDREDCWGKERKAIDKRLIPVTFGCSFLKHLFFPKLIFMFKKRS